MKLVGDVLNVVGSAIAAVVRIPEILAGKPKDLGKRVRNGEMSGRGMDRVRS